MKLKRKELEALALLAVFLVGMYIWTLPIRNSPLPYGEADAASHFGFADSWVLTDVLSNDAPRWQNITWPESNTYKSGKLWYAPHFHMTLAFAQLLGGDRVVSMYLMLGFMCTLIVLSTFVLMRSLFGFLHGLLSSFLMLFSLRHYMPYLWGQWPQAVGFTVLPVVAYCYYHYVQDNSRTYLMYLMAGLLLTQFFLHPATFLASVALLGVYTVVSGVRKRRLPFKVFDLAFAIIVFLLVAFVVCPDQTLNVVTTFTQRSQAPSESLFKVSDFFRWYPALPALDPVAQATPASYFYFSSVYGGQWAILLLLIGVVFLLYRHKEPEWFMMSFIITVYLLIHRCMIGIGETHRSLPIESQLFYPLMALGVLAIPSFINMKRDQRKALQWALAGVLVIVVILTIGKGAYNTLYHGYGGVLRVTPAQWETAEWMYQNLPADAQIMPYGFLTLPKEFWVEALSHRNLINWMNPLQKKAEIEMGGDITHHLFDYSDLVAVGNRQEIMRLQKYEQDTMPGNRLVYNENNVKIYEVAE